MLPIDQHDQRSSERLDPLRGSIGLGKLQARAGCNAVRIVAGPAGSLLHHLIQARPERTFLRPQGTEHCANQGKTFDQMGALANP